MLNEASGPGNISYYTEGLRDPDDDFALKESFQDLRHYSLVFSTDGEVIHLELVIVMGAMLKVVPLARLCYSFTFITSFPGSRTTE
jgi:hypothetical protein